ncbi:MAG: hypothetical protein EXS08_00365 [Planctomycetes bacterium]|nr:hypothetical protein [Planctomycetota bacterium]
MPSRVRPRLVGVLFLAFVPPLAAQATPPGFGRSVAAADVNGDGFADIVVGEPGFSGGREGEGRVLVYLGSAAGPESSPSWTQVGFQQHAHFGAALAGVGDMNGDGYEDVVVGAPDFDVLRREHLAGAGAAAATRVLADAGAVAFFLGSPSGLASTPVRFRPGVEHAEHLGISIASAGDIDANGFADVVVGATGTDAKRGAAFVFLGSTSAPGAFPSSIVFGATAEVRFGFAVGGGGDIDGDGFDDVLVGAPDEGSLERGAAFVYRGSATGLSAAPSWSLAGIGGSEGDFGAALTITGDLTLDGLDEVVVGDPLGRFLGSHSFTERAGYLEVFSGSLSGPTPIGTFFAEDAPFTPWEYGHAVCPRSDLNGDGQPECVGGGPTGIGAVRGVRRLALGVFVQGVTRTGSQLDAEFGAALAAGDVDGDGFEDLLVGEPSFDGGTLDQGRVRVLAGNTAFFSSFSTTTWFLSAP